MADFATLRLTLDELTSLLHALEVAENEAHQALIFAGQPRAPHFRQMPPHIQEEQRNAAGQTYQNVTELLDYVAGVWEDSKADVRDMRGARSGLCLPHLKHRANKRRYQKGWDYAGD